MAENRLTLILENRVRGFVRGFKEASNATLGFQAASRNAKARVEGAFIDLDRKMETVASRFVTRMASMRTAILGLVAGGLIKKTTDFAGEFGTGLALVNTLLDESSKSIDDYRAALIDLSRTTGADLIDSTKALYDIVGSGISTTKEGSKAIDVLAAAQKAAAASTATTEEAANALVSVLNAYKGTGITAEEVTDKLFRTVDKGRISFKDLASVIGNVAGPAATFGVSIDDMLGSIAALTRVIGPEEAIVSLNQVISKIVNPSRGAADIFEKLGIDASAAGLKINGLTGTLEQLRAASKGDADILADLFPEQRSLRGAAILLGAEFEDLIQFTSKDLPNATGAADAAVAKLAGTFERDLKFIKAAFNENLLIIGEAVIPRVTELLRGLVGFLTANRDQVVGFFTGLLDAAKGIGKFFVDIGPTIGVAVDALVIFAKVLGTIASTLGPMLVALGPAIVAAWGIGVIIRGVQTLAKSLAAIATERVAAAAAAKTAAADAILAIERTKDVAIAAAYADAAATTKAEAEKVAAIEARQAKQLKDVEISRAAALTKAGLVPVGGVVPGTTDTAATIKVLEAKAAATTLAATTQIEAAKATREAVKATAKAEIDAVNATLLATKTGAAEKILAIHAARDVAIEAAKTTAKEQAAAEGLSLKHAHGVSPADAAKLAQIRAIRDANILAVKEAAAANVAAAKQSVTVAVAASKEEIALIREKGNAAQKAATAQINATKAVAAEEARLTTKRIADIERIEAISARGVTKVQTRAAGEIAAAQAAATTAGTKAAGGVSSQIVAAEAQAVKSLAALETAAITGGTAAGTAVKTGFSGGIKGLGNVVKTAGKGLLIAVGTLAKQALVLVVSIFGGAPAAIAVAIGAAIYGVATGAITRATDELAAAVEAQKAAADASRAQMDSDTRAFIARIMGYKDFVDAVQKQEEKLFGKGLGGEGGGRQLEQELGAARSLVEIERVREQAVGRVAELEENVTMLAERALEAGEVRNRAAWRQVAVAQDLVAEEAKGGLADAARIAAKQQLLTLASKELLLASDLADWELEKAARARAAADELSSQIGEQVAAAEKMFEADEENFGDGKNRIKDLAAELERLRRITFLEGLEARIGEAQRSAKELADTILAGSQDRLDFELKAIRLEWTKRLAAQQFEFIDEEKKLKELGATEEQIGVLRIQNEQRMREMRLEGVNAEKDALQATRAAAEELALARSQDVSDRAVESRRQAMEALDEREAELTFRRAMVEKDTFADVFNGRLDQVRRLGEEDLDNIRERWAIESRSRQAEADQRIADIRRETAENVRKIKESQAGEPAQREEIAKLEFEAAEQVALIRAGANAADTQAINEHLRKTETFWRDLAQGSTEAILRLTSAISNVFSAISSSVEAAAQSLSNVLQARAAEDAAKATAKAAASGAEAAGKRVSEARARQAKAEAAGLAAAERRVGAARANRTPGDDRELRSALLARRNAQRDEPQLTAAIDEANAALEAATEEHKKAVEEVKAARADARKETEARKEAEREAEKALPTALDVGGLIGGLDPKGEVFGLAGEILGPIAETLGPLASLPFGQFITLVAQIPTILRGAGGFVSSVFNDLVDRFLDIPGAFNEFMVRGVPQIITAVSARIPDIIEGIVQLVPSIIKSVIESIPVIAQALAVAVYDFLADILNRLRPDRLAQKFADPNALLTAGVGAGIGFAVGGPLGAAIGGGLGLLFGHEGGIAGKMNHYREHFAGGGMVGASRRSGDVISAMLRQGEGVLTPEKGVPAIGGEQAVHMANNGVPPLAGSGVTQVSINANDAGVQALLAMLVRDVGISIASPFGTVRRAIRLNRGGGPPPMTQAVQRGVL